MKFAAYDPDIEHQHWPDVTVRLLHSRDVGAVAALLSQRESWPIDRALRAVASWLDDEHRIVLVAERAGQVLGYGKSEWLDPCSRGGDAPTGWYLAGVVVAPEARRRGVGLRLTEERIHRLVGRAERVWYFANLENKATLALHQQLGFVEQTRVFHVPGVEFVDGDGALFRLELPNATP